MNVRYEELEACLAAIETWLEHLCQVKMLPERGLYRKWHLLCLQEICQIKLAKHRYTKKEFQWKIKDVDAFTLLQCYISLPCEDNSALRRFMAKLDQKKPDAKLQMLRDGNLS